MKELTIFSYLLCVFLWDCKSMIHVFRQRRQLHVCVCCERVHRNAHTSKPSTISRQTDSPVDLPWKRGRDRCYRQGLVVVVVVLPARALPGVAGGRLPLRLRLQRKLLLLLLGGGVGGWGALHDSAEETLLCNV